MTSERDCERDALLRINTDISFSDDETCSPGSSSSTSPTACSSPALNRPPAPVHASIPWRSVSVLLMLNAIQPLAFELIFPFVNQMLLEIGVVDDPKRVGFYSGLVESIFAFMSFAFVLPCCYISDRYGRKSVILPGMTGLAISIALFGLSKTFWFMVFTRCLAGMTGAVWSLMKVMIAEMTDRSKQALVFSLFSISYRLGQSLGQPIGGLLSHPERNFAWFQGNFWREYPFSLPCFVAGGIAALSVILAYFNLAETSPPKRTKCTEKTTSSDYGTFNSTDEDGYFVSKPKGLENVPALVLEEPPSWRSILTNHVMSLLVSTVGLVIASETLFALYPLFAFTPAQSGGLGLTEAGIGAHMAIRSLVSIVVMILFTPLERRFGALRVYQTFMLFWPLSFGFFPVLNVLARMGLQNSWIFYVVLLTFFTFWSFAASSWSGSNIMINDAAPSQRALSSINGIFQMAIALPTAIAPAFATSMFAVSVKYNIAGGNFVWILLASLTTLAAFHSFSLKQPTHDWRLS